MSEDNLDSFLDVIEADPDWSSDEENSIAKRVDARPTTPPRGSRNQNSSDIKFEDIFGSPIKKKSTVQASTSAGIAPSFTTNKPNLNADKTFDQEFFQKLQKTEQYFPGPTLTSSSALTSSVVGVASKSPYVLSNNATSTLDSIMDPFSRISLFKTSVTLYCDETMKLESVLKERNIGMPYVNLMAFKNWYASNKDGSKNTKKFWTSGVVVKKSAGTKTSSNGNEYRIWEINDLKDLQTSWSIFLFGSSATASSLGQIPVGAFVDVVTPSVMESTTGPLKFSVHNPSQIRHVATARYFGICSGKKKDGSSCTAVVNTIECGVCIYHASGELRKLNQKSKSLPANRKQPNANGRAPFGFVEEESTAGVITTTFGVPVGPRKKPATRMELQGGNQSLHKSSIRNGNHPSISFEQPRKSTLPKVDKTPENTGPLKLDPLKTKHLTEKDREILEALGAKNTTSDLPAMIAQNPNAGSRNYIQYLAKKQFQLDRARESAGTKSDSMEKFGDAVGMNRAKLQSMQKALNYVKKNGKIDKANPNAMEASSNKKRKLEHSASSPALSGTKASTSSTTHGVAGNDKMSAANLSKKKKDTVDVLFDFSSEEAQKILNAKSKHETLLEDVQQEEYFDRLEKKEAIEKKLLTTFTIQTNAVMCRECKYVALSQSEYCKEKRHRIRVVKATKRFFKCKDCGNRAMSLDRLPKHPCKICRSTSWLQAPMGKERKGPVLETEVLAIRGDEETFLGSSSGKLFLNLGA